MNAHRSLSQAQVLRHGPAKIALMVASEFWRASTGNTYRSDVISCFCRARELMGILETIPLSHPVAQALQPLYRECRLGALFSDQQLEPGAVRTFSTRLAESFESAATQLRESSHA